ncbi:hypothetical protein PV08_06961 [Exophiala spinifera]|uniref:Uncharacterized protein n=1 Tax=Exophiala spinifera TaxID=91928 RepID=A0A0D2B654_9EURO|nr:uncharacterized protein PV08_06961 [Exophiala spinifera]KIW14180.1 hypothetical protein PV08_06961 [Exophiala spinifera]
MDSQQGSTLRQSHAEICPADHTDLSGDSSNSLLAHGERCGTVDQPSFPNIAASGDAEQQYQFELQEVARYLRSSPYNDQRPEFFLPAEQFQQFEEELERRRGFAGARPKYDYSYATGTLTLRMPSHMHEALVADLNQSLIGFLLEARKNKETPVSSFAKSIFPMASADVRYPSKDGTDDVLRQPDFEFRTVEHPEYPVLIAQEYIEQTEGHIRTVIAIDLNYPKGKGAQLLVWRAKFGEDGKFEGIACDSMEIRSKDGAKNPNSQARLVISLQDFTFGQGKDEDVGLQSVTVTLLADDLYSVLERMEQLLEAN